jgi:hypothetical protein
MVMGNNPSLMQAAAELDNSGHAAAPASR